MILGFLVISLRRWLHCHLPKPYIGIYSITMHILLPHGTPQWMDITSDCNVAIVANYLSISFILLLAFYSKLWFSKALKRPHAHCSHLSGNFSYINHNTILLGHNMVLFSCGQSRVAAIDGMENKYDCIYHWRLLGARKTNWKDKIVHLYSRIVSKSQFGVNILGLDDGLKVRWSRRCIILCHRFSHNSSCDIIGTYREQEELAKGDGLDRTQCYYFWVM